MCALTRHAQHTYCLHVVHDMILQLHRTWINCLLSSRLVPFCRHPSANQRMVHIYCPLIKLASTSTSSGSSGGWQLCESEQLADIAACGVVLLNMLGGRLKGCTWGYSSTSTSSSSFDIASTSTAASAAAGVQTSSSGTSAIATASAEVPYLLPADYADVLSKDCQRLLQRLLSPNHLLILLSTAELLQDSWVQHNLTPAAVSLNQKCRAMRPLWKEAEQQLPDILAAAASTELGFKLWQHLTDMQKELEVTQQQLNASLFGCSSIAVHAAYDSQQHRRLWACNLLLQEPAYAGRDARRDSQLVAHAASVQGPGAGLLPQPEPPQLLRDDEQQQAQVAEQQQEQLAEQHQDLQHQESLQPHVHDQQSTQQYWQQISASWRPSAACLPGCRPQASWQASISCLQVRAIQLAAAAAAAAGRKPLALLLLWWGCASSHPCCCWRSQGMAPWPPGLRGSRLSCSSLVLGWHLSSCARPCHQPGLCCSSCCWMWLLAFRHCTARTRPWCTAVSMQEPSICCSRCPHSLFP